MFLLDIEFWIDKYFFHYLKNVVLLSADLYNF